MATGSRINVLEQKDGQTKRRTDEETDIGSLQRPLGGSVQAS